MAYGLIDTERKRLSQVVAAKDDLHGRVAMEFQTKAISVAGADTVIEPMGVLIGQDAGGDWGVITGATDIDGYLQVGVVVGDKNGVGFNSEDVTLVAGGTIITALVKGDAAVLYEGLELGSTDTYEDDILAALEAQGIKVVNAAPQVAITLA